MTRDEIVAEAKKWIDTPFLHQGRAETGVDCVGLTQMVANAFNEKYEDIAGYARAPHDIQFLRHLRQYTTAQPIRGDKHGLIGVFRQQIFPCHIGIFEVDKDGVTWVINSRADRRKVVREEWDPQDLVLVELRGFPGMEN